MAGIDYLRNFLKEENFHYDEKETFIAFKFQGTQYAAFRNNDSPYLQLALIFFDVTPENREICLEACNAVNSEKFMIKYTLDNDSVWVNYEFIPTDETSSDDFQEILTLMDMSRKLFYEKVQE